MSPEHMVRSQSVDKKDASGTKTIFSSKQKKTSSFWKYLKYVAIVLVLGFAWFIYILGPLRGFLWDIPYIFGLFSQKEYLVIFQNNYELRPSGGFISAYGELKFSRGMPDLEIHDSYNIDYLEYRDPPTPLKTFLSMDPKFRGWQFRDANFYPDYSQSVEQILSFYNEKYPDKRFHGVIAVDMLLLERLLGVLGPVKVGAKTFDKDNIFMQTQLLVKNIDLHDEASLEQRKDVLGPLGKAIIWEMMMSPLSWGKIFDTIHQSLEEKHILLNFRREALQQDILLENYGGRFHGSDYNNFVYVDSSNIGGRKSDRYMQKLYDYDLTLDDDGKALVKINISFKHLGTYHLQSDLYQGYIRTLLPLGGKIIGVTGDYWKGLNDEFHYDTSEMQGAKMIGTYIHLFPGESRNIQIEYQLPFDFNKENLTLALIKQPGTYNDLWSASVQMPTDFFIKNVGEDKLELMDNVATWKGILDRDKIFEIEKMPDTYPPIVIEQKFRSLNEIEIFFSEAMDKNSVLDKNNYAVGDANFINKSEDEIDIRNIRIEEHSIIIETSGITPASEERFSVLLHNLKDKSGNTMEPNPFVLTVVQRL